MANFIEADVIQKIATEAQWLTQTRIPYKGQIMLVSDSTGRVVNMKVGDGSNTFANLNYMFDFENSQRISAVAPGELPTPTEANTYMVVTQIGDYTFGGNTIASITEDGYQATLWWTGSTWVSNGTVRVMGEDATVSNDWGNRDNVAISEAKASLLNTQINSDGQPPVVIGDVITPHALVTSSSSVFLHNKGGAAVARKAKKFRINVNSAGTVTLIQYGVASGGIDEKSRYTFSASSGLNEFTIDIDVAIGDRFGVSGGILTYGGTGGGGFFSAPISRNPSYFTDAELVTPTENNYFDYNIELEAVDKGLVYKVSDLEANKADSSAVVKNNELTIIPGKNKFDKSSMVIENRIVNTNGTLATFTGGKVARTPVKPLTKYSFFLSRYGGTLGGVVTFLDSNLSIISYIVSDTLPISSSGIGRTLTTPAGTAFVHTNLYIPGGTYADITDTFQIEEGEAVTDYSPYEQVIEKIKGFKLASSENTSADDRVLIDKNIAFFGDSITASLTYDYVARIMSHIEFKSVSRVARSGATWTNTVDTVYDITSTSGAKTPDNVIWNQFNKLKKQISDGMASVPDIIYISAGTNDSSRPFGDVATAFTGAIKDKPAGEVLTIAECVRWNVELMLQEWPNAQIILATPIQRAVANNATFHTIGDIINDCGKRLSVPVIRQDYEIGIYGYNEVAQHIFLYDDTHPNLAGANKMGDYLATRLLGIIGK